MDRCKIFTPNEYVEEMLNAIHYSGENIIGKYVLENSCGEGSILVKVVNRYILAAKRLNYSNQRIKKDLEKYIIGFEIDHCTMEKCVANLNNETIKHGISGVRWNIKNEDYLRTKVSLQIDYIIGNPPYIMYQNLTDENRNYLKHNFYSCSEGKFDYCYAFIEKSISELSKSGVMTYIIPNSIFKNKFGRRLRGIIKDPLEVIYDYKERRVFSNALTSPAIIFLRKKSKKQFVNYRDMDFGIEFDVKKADLGEKWIFTRRDTNIITRNTKKFKDFFKVSNGVATLLNSVFVININEISFENDHFIDISGHRLEKCLLRPAASPRSCVLGRREYIIFPYKYENDELIRIKEQDLAMNYPGIYNYLFQHMDKLKARNIKYSTKWFEFGRGQALSHINQEKILISTVITNEVRLFYLDKYTVPYSGFFITQIAERSLSEAEDILRSDKFYSYLSVRGINANGKSLRFSVDDFLNYPLE